MTLPLNTYLVGDALRILRTFPDGCVDCVVTSPPYWKLRDYGVKGQLGLEKTPQRYIKQIVKVFGEARRVLKENGTLWLNLGDSYADGTRDYNSFRRDRSHVCVPKGSVPCGYKSKDLLEMPSEVVRALRMDGWYLRSRIPWIKRTAMPESVKDRPTTAIEYVFLLSKSRHYYYDREAVKIPASPDSHARYARGRSDHHKYADGGPGNQTIARRFPDHDRLPGVNPKAQKRVSGWDTGPGGHRELIGRYNKEEDRDVLDLRVGSRMGREPGWRTKQDGHGRRHDGFNERCKQNESFCGAIKDVVDTRARRNSDWFFDSWQGLMTDQDGDPIAFVVNPHPFKDSHFATFPPKLVRPCILAGCPEGGVVLDPFGGSGTVGLVAKKLMRNYVLIDLSGEYCEMGERRISRECGDLL